MKKILLMIILLGVLMIVLPTVIADSIGSYPQNTQVQLYQNCNNCTYCNITRVNNQNNATLLSNVEMTKDDTYFYYNLNEDKTILLGSYKYCWKCGNTVEDLAACTDFEIIPGTGSGTANIVFFVFMILMIYGLNLFGFFGKNEILTILGGMALIFLGLYIINNGMIIYRDDLTNYFAYITIAWGFVSGIWAGLSLTEVL